MDKFFSQTQNFEDGQGVLKTVLQVQSWQTPTCSSLEQ